MRALGPVCLDTCLHGPEPRRRGRATVELRDPGGERSVDLWVDEQFEHLMCFTGDTLEEGRRRRSLAVEPMTCPPDAFRSRTDLVTLDSGGSWIGSWGIRPH